MCPFLFLTALKVIFFCLCWDNRPFAPIFKSFSGFCSFLCATQTLKSGQPPLLFFSFLKLLHYLFHPHMAVLEPKHFSFLAQKVSACPLCSQWACGISPSHSLAVWVIPWFPPDVQQFTFPDGAQDCDISAPRAEVILLTNINLHFVLWHCGRRGGVRDFFFFSLWSGWILSLKRNPLTQICSEPLDTSTFFLLDSPPPGGTLTPPRLPDGCDHVPCRWWGEVDANAGAGR